MFHLPKNIESDSFKSKQPELDARAILELHCGKCTLLCPHYSLQLLCLQSLFHGASRKNNEVLHV